MYVRTHCYILSTLHYCNLNISFANMENFLKFKLSSFKQKILMDIQLGVIFADVVDHCRPASIYS